MGRPVNNRNFGATGGTSPTIPIRADIGGTDFEGFISRQVGSRRYFASNDGGTVSGKATLVNKITGHDAGECSIVGLAQDGEAKACQKLTNRVFMDFSEVKYTWATLDDSTESLLILTQIS
tara:strand:- start:5731 stop:6093 length:363 start_codon:yes stop_codon:yes gene_type:complete